MYQQVPTPKSLPLSPRLVPQQKGIRRPSPLLPLLGKAKVASIKLLHKNRVSLDPPLFSCESFVRSGFSHVRQRFETRSRNANESLDSASKLLHVFPVSSAATDRLGRQQQRRLQHLEHELRPQDEGTTWDSTPLAGQATPGARNGDDEAEQHPRRLEESQRQFSLHPAA